MKKEKPTNQVSGIQPLLTVEDLEQLLRVNRRTVSRLCKSGQLPQPLKLGGGNRWRVKDIVDAVDSLKSREVIKVG